MLGALYGVFIFTSKIFVYICTARPLVFRSTDIWHERHEQWHERHEQWYVESVVRTMKTPGVNHLYIRSVHKYSYTENTPS